MTTATPEVEKAIEDGVSKESHLQKAVRFFSQLCDSVESLGGIAEEYGNRTLTDLMYLQQAILKGTYIEIYAGESHILSVLRPLPSVAEWQTYVREVVDF